MTPEYRDEAAATFDDSTRDIQARLKQLLQAKGGERKFESLTAALIGRLLGLPIAVAKSGFQHGGDAGPAGEHGRRFRLECKKYADGTSLNERELLGEIDHALAADEALEAWVLVATRAVPEQTRVALVGKGEKEGIPVLFVDWREHQIAPFAALCAFAPQVVAELLSSEAADLARALGPSSQPAIDSLRRSLQSWHAGYDYLRERSHQQLHRVWNSPTSANAVLGQDAAGGAQPKRIVRTAVNAALDAWWRDGGRGPNPVAVVGLDGVGKTWAALDWLSSNASSLPIVLTAPASALAGLTRASETTVKRLLAELLHELTRVRSEAHWLRRLDNLMKRPAEEGPVIALWLDGLNQEPGVDWLGLLKILQGDCFAGRIRVILTVRPHFLKERLAGLKALTLRPTVLEVQGYDTARGSELDQMLAFEGLSQKDFNPGMIEMARVPRLFKIVVQMRERLRHAGTITVHRLLWEYGKDSFGERASRSFSESEWQDWLRMLARRYRSGQRNFDLKSLSESTSRPDLSQRETYARLSEMVDGKFVPASPAGTFEPSAVVVAHALALALISMLDSLDDASHARLESTLTEWLDPITAWDERSEVLRAAVSIQMDRDRPESSTVIDVLVSAWLQGQNVSDEHRQELIALAPQLVSALLHTMEKSSVRSQASARLWSMDALCNIPRTDLNALDTIVAKAKLWASVLSMRWMPAEANDHPDAKKIRSQRFLDRIGTDRPGPLKVLGADLELVDYSDGVLLTSIPELIAGFPLERTLPIVEAAAIVAAIDGPSDGWRALSWTFLLNAEDPDETSRALRALSGRVRNRVAEPGIHPNMPVRVACMLLDLTGEEQDEERAASPDRALEPGWDYQSTYLDDPANSFFKLERRHAQTVLQDARLPALQRASRLAELWLDPEIVAPVEFVEALGDATAEFPVEKLDVGRAQTREDIQFGDLEPALARCEPAVLADLIRRKYRECENHPAQFAYWKVHDVMRHFLLVDASDVTAVAVLRGSDPTAFSGDELGDVSSLLLGLEIKGMRAMEQFHAVIAAGLEHVPVFFEDILHKPSAAEIDALIDRYGDDSIKRCKDLLVLLSIHAHEHRFSDRAWNWLSALACSPESRVSGQAFRTLAESDAMRLGRDLLRRGWAWRSDADKWESHYGSLALICASEELAFEELAHRIAPWCLLEAFSSRGKRQDEAIVAIAILDSILGVDIAESGQAASIEIDRERIARFPFSCSVGAREEDVDLATAFNLAAMNEAHRRAFEGFQKQVDQAGEAGAYLHLAQFSASDFIAALDILPDAFDLWVEGAEHLTPGFRRKVALSEGAYVALCEALLDRKPALGVVLWRALNRVLSTRFTGKAEVNDLLHMVFRAPASDPLSDLRQSLLEFPRCNSDRFLFDLAFVASYNGAEQWLERQIQVDLASAQRSQRMRGVVLAGFTGCNDLPVKDAWHEGGLSTSHAERRHKAAMFRWRDACARHWWRRFLMADNEANAYAAWALFLEAVDSRGYLWMNQEVLALEDDTPLFMAKIAHTRVNASRIRKSMKKNEKKLDGKFLALQISRHVYPWRHDRD